MRTNGGNLFGIYDSRRVSHHYMHLTQIQRQAEEWESFTGGKREVSGCDPIEGFWRAEAGGGLARSGASYMIA